MKSYSLYAMIVLLSGPGAMRPQAIADDEILRATAASAAIADTLDLPSSEATDTVPTSAENPTASLRREAVVDMNFLFKNDPVFRERQQQMKSRLEACENEEQDFIAEMRALTVQMQLLNCDCESAAREALQAEVDSLQATMVERSRTLRHELQWSESQMYYTSYRRISSAIARYARENGIHLVRRVKTVAEIDRDAVVSPGEMPALEEYDPEVNLHDPQEILSLINRDIVYMEDEPIDITQAVLARLTREPGSNAGSTAR